MGVDWAEEVAMDKVVTVREGWEEEVGGEDALPKMLVPEIEGEAEGEGGEEEVALPVPVPHPITNPGEVVRVGVLKEESVDDPELLPLWDDRAEGVEDRD